MYRKNTLTKLLFSLLLSENLLKQKKESNIAKI